MISERRFASAYTSVWRTLLPLSDRFLRRLNLESERFRPPFSSSVPASESALVNELAFRIFRANVKEELLSGDLSIEVLDRLFNETRQYLARIAPGSVSRAGRLRKRSTHDALMLSVILAQFFSERDLLKRLVFNPSFPGCGIVGACEADVVSPGVLYEIKGGDREFRTVDLRQLLVYAALDSFTDSLRIRELALLNPRQGVFWQATISEVCIGVAAMTPADLLPAIREAMVDESVSR